jgi:hypothetical protein
MHIRCVSGRSRVAGWTQYCTPATSHTCRTPLSTSMPRRKCSESRPVRLDPESIRTVPRHSEYPYQLWVVQSSGESSPSHCQLGQHAHCGLRRQYMRRGEVAPKLELFIAIRSGLVQRLVLALVWKPLTARAKHRAAILRRWQVDRLE